MKIAIHARDVKAELFWPKVSKRGHGGCWLWMAYRMKSGYGRFGVRGNSSLAHCVSWILAGGAIPNGKELDHKCGNKSCVNPKHLRLATRSQNRMNCPARSDSKTGVTGVHFYKRSSKWTARIYNTGLGYFQTFEEAVAARRAAEKHFFQNFHIGGLVEIVYDNQQGKRSSWLGRHDC